MTVKETILWGANRAAKSLGPPAERYAQLGRSLRDVVARDTRKLDTAAFVPGEAKLGDHVDLRVESQGALLESWRGNHTDLFAALRSDPKINTLNLGQTHLHNSQYPTPDAEIYAAMIAERQPKKIVEIGAGFSTLIARHTIESLRLDAELVVIDPEPRTDVVGYADRILRKRVEDVAPNEMALGEHGLLFIDSSHVVRAKGDLPALFCGLVPGLASGSLVHVHDVFLPYDYPDAYRLRMYGEAYLLWALLTDAPRYQVALATHFMTRNYGDLMRAVFGEIVGRDDRYYGASFWFDVV